MLIVGCGCRGRALARVMCADGHAVTGTTRDPARMAEIAASGAEPFHGDPDRIGTLMPALAAVTVVCWLAGTATGDSGRTAALHGDRLQMFFEKLVDSPVRGVVYEAAGGLDEETFRRGRQIARRASATWALPVVILEADPREFGTWLPAARSAVAALLTPAIGDR